MCLPVSRQYLLRRPARHRLERRVRPSTGVQTEYDVASDDHQLAGELAEEAGARLLKLRHEHGFDDPKALRSAGDRLAHEYLLEALTRARSGDAVLSEEGADDRRRLSASRVWIVDPLDGTREFAEEGRDDWAVHVALWEEGVLTAGAVALPARGYTLTTASPPACATPREAGPRIAASRTRPPEFVSQVADDLSGELVPMGSAGAKIAAVIEGNVDAYIHAGGQFEWDSAAPVAVAIAAGAHTSRIDGSQLTYNREDPRVPDLLVCHPVLASRLLASVPDSSRAG